MLIPLAALLAGIGAAAGPGWFVPAASFYIALACTLAAFLLKRRIFLVAALSLLCFIWGDLSLQNSLHPDFPPRHIARLDFPEPVVVTGIIDSRPEARERGMRLYLEAETVESDNRTIPVSGRILLYVGEGRSSCLTGDRVRVRTRLREPRNFGLPGEYDYRRQLALKGVYCTGFIAKADDLLLVQAAVAHPVQRRIDALAFRLGDFIDAAVAQPESGILKALLIGERGNVSRETEDLYARGGVNHILSISGFHVGIIALFLYQLFSLVARRSEYLLLFNLRRIIFLATLPVLFFYLLLTGAAPATTRSVLMIAACCIGLLVERELDPVNLISLAAVAILAVSPQVLFDLSFQLSFLAIWGIVVLSPIMMRPFAGVRRRTLRTALQFCTVSVAAIAATLLPVAYHFHRITLIGLLSNIVVVPLMGYGAVVLGFVGLGLALWAPVLAKPLLLAAGLLVRYSDAALLFLDRLPQLPRFTPTQLEVALAIALLAGITLLSGKRW